MNETPKMENSEVVLTFCSATRADIDGILAVQGSRQDVTSPEQLEGLDTKIESEGFMEELFTREELEKLFKDPDGIEIMVCKSEDKISAYIVGYRLEKWLKLFPNWLKTTKFNGPNNIENSPADKTIYIRHVCSLPNNKHHLGSKLFSTFLQKISKVGYTQVLCETLKRPLVNRASAGLFKRYGGTEIADVIENHSDTEYLWGLYSIKI